MWALLEKGSTNSIWNTTKKQLSSILCWCYRFLYVTLKITLRSLFLSNQTNIRTQQNQPFTRHDGIEDTPKTSTNKQFEEKGLKKGRLPHGAARPSANPRRPNRQMEPSVPYRARPPSRRPESPRRRRPGPVSLPGSPSWPAPRT